MQYYPVHLHLHTSMETGGSLAGHIYNAKKLGMRYIWFTDHDYRLYIRRKAIRGFDFLTPETSRISETDGFPEGWSVTPAENAEMVPCCDRFKMKIHADGKDNTDWNAASAEFVSGKNFTKSRHVCSLQHDVTVRMNLNADVSDTENARIIITVPLSKRPPDGQYGRMLYVLGNTQGLEATHTQIIPLKLSNGELSLHVSEDVSDDPDIGGRDNAFGGVTVTVEARGSAHAGAVIGASEFVTTRFGDEVRSEQRKLAENLYRETGVQAFIASEFSEIGMHKNCFNTDIPLLPMREEGFTEDEGSAYLKENHAVFAYNHPLAGKISSLERAEELLATRAYGATLMEVGYPEGRYGTLDEYLELWDILTASGLFLTAYGSSDSHDMTKNWFSGNNFCAYLGVADSTPEPITESVFLEAMRRGNAYTGDPTKLSGKIDFTAENGAPQGSILRRSIGDSVKVRFSASEVLKGWKFRCIKNHEITDTVVLEGGEFSYETQLTLTKPVSFCRCELWDENGRLILLTNPIHLVRSSVSDIPAVRLFEENGANE